MSRTSSLHPLAHRLFADSSGMQTRRVPAVLWALVLMTAVIGTGYELFAALRPPGQIIRGELEAAAAEVRSLPANEPISAVGQAVGRHFRDHSASVDARGYPAPLTVTLYGLDQATCRDAADAARRIEGLVVVSLLGYGSPGDCRAKNDMTWRISP